MGELSPVIVGIDVAVPVGTTTRSDRQTPSPGTTFVELVQLAVTQLPLRNT